MLQNPVRVTGMEEEPLNKSHGQRGNIAGNKLYYCFYLLPLFAFLLMLPVGKKSRVHSLSTPFGLVRMGLGLGTLPYQEMRSSHNLYFVGLSSPVSGLPPAFSISDSRDSVG